MQQNKYENHTSLSMLQNLGKMGKVFIQSRLIIFSENPVKKLYFYGLKL
jgi:hypothetical protein